jgi:hypothetical protein
MAESLGECQMDVDVPYLAICPGRVLTACLGGAAMAESVTAPAALQSGPTIHSNSSTRRTGEQPAAALPQRKCLACRVDVDVDVGARAAPR